MARLLKPILLCAVLFGLTASVVRADQLPSVILNPIGGSLTGAAGHDVGWGFTIYGYGNDSHGDPINLWVVVTQILTTEDSPLGDLNQSGWLQYFNAGLTVVAVAPLSVNPLGYTETFSGDNQTGLGAYSISGGATDPAADFGTFQIHYDAWDGDPNVCGSCTTQLFDQILKLSDGVSDPAFEVHVQAVPEPNFGPAVGGLLLCAAAGAAWRRRRA
jgi:hypothetical protein